MRRFTALLIGLLAAGASYVYGGEAMQLIPSHPLAKVPQAGATSRPTDPTLRMEAAEGETVSSQAVLVAGEAGETVTAAITDLKQAGGAMIPAGTVTLQWVRYLDLSKNTPGIPENELVAKAPVNIPDAFWEEPERAVEAKSVQPVWIEIRVPADAVPGEYHGTLSVAGNNSRAELPVTVRVRNFRLLDERHQRVIQWSDFPGRGFERIKPGTDEYRAFLQQFCEFLHRHRQTDLRATWGMITPKSPVDGKPSWDVSAFEQYADIAFEAGLRAIQLDAAARHTKFQLEQDSRTEAVADNLGRLTALQELVVRRGWQGRIFTSIADEPFIYHEKSYRTVLEQVRKAAPAVGVIEAVETEDLGDIDIYVPKLSHFNLWQPYYENLKRQKKEIWFYTCCHPVGRYPNRFLDQPLVKARELHWISYLYGLDGFLHWGLNWYAATGDPYSEKGRNPWDLPPGDPQVAYPGKAGWLGSLRLSAMRDGLQDYEYLWTLESRLRELKQKLGDEARWMEPRQRPLELCRRVVQSAYEHTRDPQLLLATRSAIADEIEAFDAKPMLYVQTSPPDGAVAPPGPTMINIRGVASPSAKITVNGKAILEQNISPGGCFIDAQFITVEKPEIVITAELGKRTVTVKRAFRVSE